MENMSLAKVFVIRTQSLFFLCINVNVIKRTNCVEKKKEKEKEKLIVKSSINGPIWIHQSETSTFLLVSRSPGESQR